MRAYMLGFCVIVLFLASCSGLSATREAELVENGYKAMSQGDYNTAEHLLNQALAINGENPYALLNLGVVYQDTRRFDEARKLYQSVIDLSPSQTAAVTNVEGHAGKNLAEIARFNLNNLPSSPDKGAPGGGDLAVQSGSANYKQNDNDADGVLNESDKCDNTPFAANVDANGCWTLMGLFPSGKSEIGPDVQGQLKNVIEVLSQNPSLRIEIQGHTDNTGSAAANKRLSEKRAQSVMQYLIEQGIESERLQWAGYGQTQPIAPNNTAIGRNQNRRVELMPLP